MEAAKEQKKIQVDPGEARRERIEKKEAKSG